MNYQFFINESGYNGLTKIDTNFPVFLVCAVLVKEEDYESMQQSIKISKHSIWSNKDNGYYKWDSKSDAPLNTSTNSEYNRLIQIANYAEQKGLKNAAATYRAAAEKAKSN